MIIWYVLNFSMIYPMLQTWSSVSPLYIGVLIFGMFYLDTQSRSFLSVHDFVFYPIITFTVSPWHCILPNHNVYCQSTTLYSTQSRSFLSVHDIVFNPITAFPVSPRHCILPNQNVSCQSTTLYCTQSSRFLSLHDIVFYQITTFTISSWHCIVPNHHVSCQSMTLYSTQSPSFLSHVPFSINRSLRILCAQNSFQNKYKTYYVQLRVYLYLFSFIIYS